eukprot:g19326.t1
MSPLSPKNLENHLEVLRCGGFSIKGRGLRETVKFIGMKSALPSMTRSVAHVKRLTRQAPSSDDEAQESASRAQPIRHVKVASQAAEDDEERSTPKHNSLLSL